MATRSASSTSSAPTAASTSMSTVLQHQLDNSTSATIYVPLEDGDPPTEADLKSLAAAGIHAEVDVVRNALAVRKATEDEIAEATAPAEAAEPTSSSSD